MYLILNFKTYPQSTGKESVQFARIVANAQQQTDVQIIICPQLTDLYRIKQELPGVMCWAQHVDPLPAGRNTGWITPLAIKDAGASGALVNHSEHSLLDEMVVHTLDAMGEEKLQTCVCIPNERTIKGIQNAYRKMESETELRIPNFIAYEPPELIGGDFSAVDSEEYARPTQEALGAIKAFGSIPLLGAGIKNPDDITQAVEMGYEGVLIASGFIKSGDPAHFLQRVLDAFPS